MEGFNPYKFNTTHKCWHVCVILNGILSLTDYDMLAFLKKVSFQIQPIHINYQKNICISVMWYDCTLQLPILTLGLIKSNHKWNYCWKTMKALQVLNFKGKWEQPHSPYGADLPLQKHVTHFAPIQVARSYCILQAVFTKYLHSVIIGISEIRYSIALDTATVSEILKICKLSQNIRRTT